MSSLEKLKCFAAIFEHQLQQLYLDNEPQKKLFDAMRYSLLAGGKRLRPYLVQEFCRAAGRQPVGVLSPAIAVEMIHTYSLIHDDLPCMDNDDCRRGKPTNHKVYGEAMAVLAGDALLTEAFRVIAEDKDLPSERKSACIATLARCAGAFGMVGGQALDIESEHRICTAQEVFDIQSRKTGALLRAACRMGAICGGATEMMLQAANDYADALGLAFQIQDDILDVEGDAKTLGKAVGVDERKNTYVRLFGLEKCHAMVREYTEQAKRALSPYAKAAQPLCALADILCTRAY